MSATEWTAPQLNSLVDSMSVLSSIVPVPSGVAASPVKNRVTKLSRHCRFFSWVSYQDCHFAPSGPVLPTSRDEWSSEWPMLYAAGNVGLRNSA